MKRFILICVALMCVSTAALAHEEDPNHGPKPPETSAPKPNFVAVGVGVVAILVAGGAGWAIYSVIRKGL